MSYLSQETILISHHRAPVPGVTTDSSTMVVVGGKGERQVLRKRVIQNMMPMPVGDYVLHVRQADEGGGGGGETLATVSFEVLMPDFARQVTISQKNSLN